MLKLSPKNIIETQAKMEKERAEYEPVKTLCTQLAYPERSDQWTLFGLQKGQNHKRSRRIYDSTAVQGMTTWSNGIMGFYMPKEINWFNERMGDKSLNESKIVRKFLQETDEHLRSVLDKSNYYEQKRTAVKDAGAIGDSFMFIDNDSESNGNQIMSTPHPRECWIRRDYWGRVVVIHHKFTKTLREIEGEYGLKALSEVQQQNLKTNSEETATIIHGVYKNRDYQPDSIGIKNMPWQHFYINSEAQKEMKRTGSTTLNPIPWSLYRPTHEMYGRGIVAQMLVEIITTNLIGKDILEASGKAVAPPMLMSGALKHKLDLGMKAVNYVGAKETQGLKMGDLMAKLVDTSGYPFGVDQHERWQNMVNNGFAVPLFLAMNMNEAGNRTAYEVRQRQAERAALMAPFLGTLGSTTDMELDRIYSIELEANRAPEIPQEVLASTNGRIDIEHVGPLSQLLKQYYETGSLLTTIANIRAVLEISPDSAIVVEGDELMRRILQSGNAPEDVIRSQEDVMEIQAIAAEQAEQERMAAMAVEASKAVPNISGKIDKDSILGGMTAA